MVALWLGFNSDNLTLLAVDDVLEDSHCVQGLGQNPYCNVPAFFEAAHDALRFAA